MVDFLLGRDGGKWDPIGDAHSNGVDFLAKLEEPLENREIREHELDVLGLTDDGLVAGECTFTSQPVSEGVLADLERTVSEVRWAEGPADGEPLYVLFSRSGYTDDLKNVAETRDDVRLFGLSDLLS